MIRTIGNFAGSGPVDRSEKLHRCASFSPTRDSHVLVKTHVIQRFYFVEDRLVPQGVRSGWQDKPDTSNGSAKEMDLDGFCLQDMPSASRTNRSGSILGQIDGVNDRVGWRVIQHIRPDHHTVTNQRPNASSRRPVRRRRSGERARQRHTRSLA
jgi:hypothetical protein